MLHDDGACRHLFSMAHVPNLDGHELTSAQLAVDAQVEERQPAHAALQLQTKRSAQMVLAALFAVVARPGTKCGGRAGATRAEAVKGWRPLGQALAMSGEVADRNLSRAIPAFVKNMHSPGPDVARASGNGQPMRKRMSSSGCERRAPASS